MGLDLAPEVNRIWFLQFAEYLTGSWANPQDAANHYNREVYYSLKRRNRLDAYKELSVEELKNNEKGTRLVSVIVLHNFFIKPDLMVTHCNCPNYDLSRKYPYKHT